MLGNLSKTRENLQVSAPVLPRQGGHGVQEVLYLDPGAGMEEFQLGFQGAGLPRLHDLPPCGRQHIHAVGATHKPIHDLPAPSLGHGPARTHSQGQSGQGRGGRTEQQVQHRRFCWNAQRLKESTQQLGRVPGLWTPIPRQPDKCLGGFMNALATGIHLKPGALAIPFQAEQDGVHRWPRHHHERTLPQVASHATGGQYMGLDHHGAKYRPIQVRLSHQFD
jgi:hypothetical protein